MNSAVAFVPRRRQLAAMQVLLAVALAACSGGNSVATPGGSAPPASTQTSAPPLATAVTPPTQPAPTASPSPALELLWEASGPVQPTPCCQTWWPAIDPKSGNVWVANSFANEFWIFTPDGKFVEAWGTPGSGDGEFDFSAHREQPQSTGAIAFAADGSFYVVDDGNHRIQKFSADRHYLLQWGGFGESDGKFAQAFGILTDGTTVYVSDDDRGDIQAFDAKGTFQRTMGSITTQAGIFMALDADGNVYRSGETPTGIVEYDSTGKKVGQLDLPTDGLVTGLAVAPNGHLFANVGWEHPDRRELFELDASGIVLHQWSTGGETAAVDPKGDAIYLASGRVAGWPTASLRKYALPGG